MVSYGRWFSNDTGASPNADVFQIDINNGSGWVSVETVGPALPGTAGGWVYSEFQVDDIVIATSTVQMRFVASDLGGGSIVEAGLDDFRVRELTCGTVPCPGDLDGDLDVDLADLAVLLSNFGTPSDALPEDGDIDGDGDVDLADLAILLSAFGTICP